VQSFHVRLAASLFAFLPLLTAQITTTTVRGTITDSTGAVVPNVEITVTNTETNQTRSVKSSADGQYTLEFLPLGLYTIQASATGFRRFVQTGVVLELNQVARVDAVLELGSTSDAITVVGDAPVVNTDNASIGRTVESAEITGLPIVNRNIYTLLQLTPGVE
jgi:hypothetical protein